MKDFLVFAFVLTVTIITLGNIMYSSATLYPYDDPTLAEAECYVYEWKLYGYDEDFSENLRPQHEIDECLEGLK